MTEETRISNWIQDNLRIIISIGIVILLVFAIYSYSKRNANPVVVDEIENDDSTVTTNEDRAEVDQIIDEIKDEEQSKVADVATDASIVSENKDSAISEAQTEPETVAEISQQEPSQGAEVTEQPQEQAPATDDAQSIEKSQPATQEEEKKQTATEVVREVINSQKKNGTITVTAESGDSATTLARKAARQYIAQENMTDLTAAHKIYIEDYLRRSKNARGIHPGTTLEFSTAEITDAINHARQLNDAQLKHLNTYAQHVTNI